MAWLQPITSPVLVLVVDVGRVLADVLDPIVPVRVGVLADERRIVDEAPAPLGVVILGGLATSTLCTASEVDATLGAPLQC